MCLAGGDCGGGSPRACLTTAGESTERLEACVKRNRATSPQRTIPRSLPVAASQAAGADRRSERGQKPEPGKLSSASRVCAPDSQARDTGEFGSRPRALLRLAGWRWPRCCCTRRDNGRRVLAAASSSAGHDMYSDAI